MSLRGWASRVWVDNVQAWNACRDHNALAVATRTPIAILHDSGDRQVADELSERLWRETSRYQGYVSNSMHDDGWRGSIRDKLLYPVPQRLSQLRSRAPLTFSVVPRSGAAPKPLHQEERDLAAELRVPIVDYRPGDPLPEALISRRRRSGRS